MSTNQDIVIDADALQAAYADVLHAPNNETIAVAAAFLYATETLMETYENADDCPQDVRDFLVTVAQGAERLDPTLSS